MNFIEIIDFINNRIADVDRKLNVNSKFKRHATFKEVKPLMRFENTRLREERRLLRDAESKLIRANTLKVMYNEKVEWQAETLAVPFTVVEGGNHDKSE